MLNLELITELLKNDGGRFQVSSLEKAYTFCSKLTKSHYENFPVASILIAKEYRKYIYSIYAFARLADDIADENIDGLNKIESLHFLEENISVENKSNPVFWALQDTIKKIKLDKQLLIDLLIAFKSDIEFKSYDSIDELLAYCSKSANPVGRIVLRVFNDDIKKNVNLSDSICSALQLTNFWQDLSRDLVNGRNYIPNNLLEKYGLSEKDLLNLQSYEEINQCLDELFKITFDLFDEGSLLIQQVKNRRLRFELKLTILGGLEILKQCNEMKHRLLVERPKLEKKDYINLVYKAIKWK